MAYRLHREKEDAQAPSREKVPKIAELAKMAKVGQNGQSGWETPHIL